MYIKEKVCYIGTKIEKLELHTETYNYLTCQNLDLHCQFCRSNAPENNVVNTGMKLHNKLQSNVEAVKNTALRWKLRSSLVQHTFYSTEQHVSY
jgi:hypothetical protein